MRCFKIGDLNITATSKKDAEIVASELENSQANQIIFVYEDDSVQIISLKDQNCVVFSQTGKSVIQVGKVEAGNGHQIMKAVVDQFDVAYRYKAKISAQSRQRNYLDKKENYNQIIKTFEEKIPENVRKQFNEIVNLICRGNLAYKVEMYQEIDHVIKMNHDNWFVILPWFKEKVLHNGDPEFTLYQKRKAFVTTVCRMGENEYRIGNTMEGVAENDREFWSNYANKDKGVS